MAPSPLSPDNTAYLTERTRRLSLQNTNTTTTSEESQRRYTPPASGFSPSPSQPGRHHSTPNTLLVHKNTTSIASKSRLKLVIEGDSPPAMTPMLELFHQTPVLSSDPKSAETTLQTTTAIDSENASQPPSTLEMSVMAEQEAELEDQELCLEEQLLQEMIERLRERQTYIRWTPLHETTLTILLLSLSGYQKLILY